LIDVRQQLTVVSSGSGIVEQGPAITRLLRPRARASTYANAELADLTPWRPPVTATVRARFSHPVDQIRGTAGFGFWNVAIAPFTQRIGLPRALWFFAAGPPYDVPIALGVPGRGYKAAVLDARRLAFLAMLPTAPLGFLAMRNRWLYERLWPLAQRAIGASEADLSDVDITKMHDYVMHWEANHVQFAIDSRPVLTSTSAPPGPLRFVIWIDNAYAIATPQGRFAVGTLDVDEPQWIDVERIELRAT
jgi:hypothetical protein